MIRTYTHHYQNVYFLIIFEARPFFYVIPRPTIRDAASIRWMKEVGRLS